MATKIYIDLEKEQLEKNSKTLLARRSTAKESNICDTPCSPPNVAPGITTGGVQSADGLDWRRAPV